MGGYDASGVPDAAGTYGASLYQYIGSNWQLLAKISVGNYTTVYPVGITHKSNWNLYDMVVPDVDLSALLTPVALDTFTDTNGTSLDAHTMDVGSGWTELGSSAWEIQGNRVEKTANNNTTEAAVVECSEADIVAEVVLHAECRQRHDKRSAR